MKCPVCEKEYDSHRAVLSHLLQKHKDQNYTAQKYYDGYIKTDDKEGICKLCGKPTTFHCIGKGYREFCSHTCCNTYTNNQPAVREKIKDTLEERYGDRNYVNVEGVRISKLAKHGYEYFPKDLPKRTVEEEKARVAKILSTKEERYGDHAYCNIEKIAQTKAERYGNANYNNGDKIHETWSNKSATEKEQINKSRYLAKKKQIISLLTNRLQNNKHIEIKDVNRDYYTLHCTKCNNDFEIMPQLLRKRVIEHREVCTVCNPLYTSQESWVEKELFEFVRDNYEGDVVYRYKIECETGRDREFDVYVPNLKLAFEFNGVYWHNELHKSSKFHLNKTNLAESVSVHLIHIYEDDWLYKNEIVKSRILNLLGKSNRIYARNCDIKVVDYSISKEFLETNHLQGDCPSIIRLGLYTENQLVALMTFGSLRVILGNNKKDNAYELLRFCNKLGCSVVGGAEKLFKHFLEKYHPISILSYADRSWTMDNHNTLYDKIGMIYIGVTEPNYYYIVKGIRQNRFKYRKDVLISDGYDRSKTEREIMFERKFYRLYDSGQLKYMWTK